MSIDDCDRTMSVYVRGVFLFYQHAARQMIAQGRGGRIIGASSMAGSRGRPTSRAIPHRNSWLDTGDSLRIGFTRYQRTCAWDSRVAHDFGHKAGIAPQVIYDLVGEVFHT
ncbi:hypothetical protein FB451DRAFT_1396306 [Mycena latifolia]|nr:hypothetical protein FB451DRAFT_1414392 [Mycena latifolia]KAJ7478541.1 hypothetical protein FB451DRAFT_1396306 [Mycena latifolia]